MAELFQQLVTDHKVLMQVLDKLQAAFEHYDEENEGYLDLPLILDALEYIQAYPETFHHPLEELAFNYLLQNNLGDREAILEIRQQHGDLEQKTDWLNQQFNAIANDRQVDTALIRERFAHFIEAQEHHLKTENKKVFSTLSKLDEKAWWDIASGIALHDDPLFSDSPERHPFQHLAEGIIHGDDYELEIWDEEDFMV